MQRTVDDYPSRLDIEYPQSLDRISTLLRPILAIPIVILVSFIPPMLCMPVALMLVVRRKYPRWWFDFNLEMARLRNRVNAYLNLMTDEYPSSDEEQSVKLELDYPDAAQLNRWLPLVKWFLAIPHYIVVNIMLLFQTIAVLIASVPPLVNRISEVRAFRQRATVSRASSTASCATRPAS